MVGLCASCRFARRIENRRGVAFWLCRRSEDDPRYPRYPVLPVLACRGHEPDPPRDPKEDESTDGGGGRQGRDQLESRVPEGDP